MKIRKICKNTMFMALIMSLILVAVPSQVNAASNHLTKQMVDINADIDREIEELGLNIIAAYDYEIPFTLTDELIAENKDDFAGMSKGDVVTVNVSWRISYTQADGLAFYTTAYGYGALLKKMTGKNKYRDPDTFSTYSYDIRTTNIVPMSRISNYVATYKKFASGKRIYCQVNVDIDAVNEISGGYFNASDTVTIP